MGPACSAPAPPGPRRPPFTELCLENGVTGFLAVLLGLKPARWSFQTRPPANTGKLSSPQTLVPVHEIDREPEAQVRQPLLVPPGR